MSIGLIFMQNILKIKKDIKRKRKVEELINENVYFNGVDGKGQIIII